VHTPRSKSKSVAEAAKDWIDYVKLERRERSTLDQYPQHVAHIVPRIGNERLANLATPSVNKFRDDLLTDLSRPMAKKVLGSLKALLRDAKRRGNVAQNVALDVKIMSASRDEDKVEAGVDFLTPLLLPNIVRKIAHFSWPRRQPPAPQRTTSLGRSS
jgi:integrase